MKALLARWLPKSLESSLRVGGGLIVAGLLVELATLFWTHALSFLLFTSVGVGLVGAGILLYLIGLARYAR